MKPFKRKSFFALILSVLIAVYSFAGCTDTRYMMTVDDEKVSAGIYLYYALNTFTYAVEEIQNENSDFDPTKKSDVENAVFNGQKLVDYVAQESIDRVKSYLVTINKFAELGLQLTEDEQAEMDDYIARFWETYSENLIENGISKSSAIECIKVMYYNQSIFNHYYKIGATEGVTDQDVRDFYVENNARVEYIPFYFQNAGGATLIGDAKEPVRQRANEYFERVQNGLDMEEAISEYMEVSSAESSAYVSSSIAQSEADAATETDPETGETVGTSATTEAVTTAPTTTSTVESGTITTVVTSTYVDADGSTLSETATETVTTAATTETETTTTTAPYQFEQIIDRVTTSEPADIVLEIEGGVTTTTTAPTYYPNQKVNEAIFATQDYDKPFIVEADDAVYLVVRYDITERMTEDDLWSEQTIDNTLVKAYQKIFFDRLDEWTKQIDVQRNNAAFNRYKLWNFVISSEV